MNPLKVLLIAVRALMRNKMRSFLTVLGVIIGVGAVIAMTAIGEGAKARVQSTFEAMGTNMLVVRSGSSDRGGVRGGSGSEPSITWDDVEAIRTQVPGVRAVSPQLQTRTQVASDSQNWQTSVSGVNPEFLMIRNWEVARGTPFSDAEVESSAKVALLGHTVATSLYGEYANPVGASIRIGNVPFEVIGVLGKKGQSAFGSDYDDTVMIPVTTYSSKIARSTVSKYVDGSVYVSAQTANATAAVQAGIEDLLRERHRLRAGEDDFSVRNLSDLATAQQEGAETMTSLLAGIALVSLLVGGIGIMNIMLVSVTERTREIGLRMAIGAKPRDILSQFLIESVVLSVMGGLAGIAAGLGAAKYLVARFNWPMLVQTDTIAIAVGFSAVVGMVFGLYPAHKASRLDPIVALRYE